jgi:predicted enzyme related to lactoylglutathione lyase
MIAPAIGALAWVGLAAADAPVAVAFYAAAFDWEAVPEANHTLLRRAGSDVALVYPQTPQARAANVTSHWTPFFSVADTELLLERLAESGGVALRGPFDVPGGRMAAIQDPAGAVFSTWEPRNPDPHRLSMSDAWWLELRTPDVEPSKAFYGDLFGWTYDQDPSGATSIRGPGGHMGRMRPVEADPAWLPCLRVTDLDEAGQRVEAAGASYAGVTVEDKGRIASILDPQGAALSLLEPARRPS